jgi:beta-amylase
MQRALRCALGVWWLASHAPPPLPLPPRQQGVGEFQCYDRRALASLARAAAEVGHPEWGNSGPHDAGHYNSNPEVSQAVGRAPPARLSSVESRQRPPAWGQLSPRAWPPQESGFFSPWGGSWESPYGAFFLRWYATSLIDHGDRLLASARGVFNVKLPGTSAGGPASPPLPQAWSHWGVWRVGSSPRSCSRAPCG